MVSVCEVLSWSSDFTLDANEWGAKTVQMSKTGSISRQAVVTEISSVYDVIF